MQDRKVTVIGSPPVEDALPGILKAATENAAAKSDDGVGATDFPGQSAARRADGGHRCVGRDPLPDLRFASALTSGRYLRVRTEDVLNDSHAQLGRIADWLGIGAHANALEAMTHPEASPFARFGLEGMEQPAGWVENEALWSMAVEVASRLGYP